MRDLLPASHPAEHGARGVATDKLIIMAREHPARCQRIDADSRPGEIGGQVACQPVGGRLGDCVRHRLIAWGLTLPLVQALIRADMPIS